MGITIRVVLVTTQISGSQEITYELLDDATRAARHAGDAKVPRVVLADDANGVRVVAAWCPGELREAVVRWHVKNFVWAGTLA